jgi:hypothetical protein
VALPPRATEKDFDRIYRILHPPPSCLAVASCEGALSQRATEKNLQDFTSSPSTGKDRGGGEKLLPRWAEEGAFSPYHREPLREPENMR